MLSPSLSQHRLNEEMEYRLVGLSALKHPPDVISAPFLYASKIIDIASSLISASSPSIFITMELGLVMMYLIATSKLANESTGHTF